MPLSVPDLALVGVAPDSVLGRLIRPGHDAGAVCAAALIFARSALYCSLDRCGYLHFSLGQVPSLRNLLQWKGLKRLPFVAETDRVCASAPFPFPPDFPPPLVVFREADAERGRSAASNSAFVKCLACEKGHAAPFEHSVPTPCMAAEWK